MTSKATQNTVLELLNLQLLYVNRIAENIPNERLYEKQLEGFNSAGWLLGHICVEADDLINQLDNKAPYKKLDEHWIKWFGNTTGKIESLSNLPTKEELLNTLNSRYKTLAEAYSNLSEIQRNGPHPSRILKGIFTTFDAWFAHHLTTHIANHCGNMVVWKKMIGIDVNGF